LSRKPGHVPVVDRFHHQRDAFTLQRTRCEAQIALHHAQQFASVCICRRNTGQTVDADATERTCIPNGLRDAGLEFAHTVRQAGNAALAARPVSGRQIEQHLFKLVSVHHGGQIGDRCRVRKMALHPGKTGAGRRRIAFHEGVFSEQQ
jgi:hypothetical protein